MKDHIPERRGGLQWKMILLLAVVWVLLWGEISVIQVIGGLLLGLLVTVVFPLPPLQFHGRFRPLGLAVLVFRLLTDLVRASWSVTRLALRFGYTPHNGVAKVQLRTIDDFYLTVTAELVTLVPGSIALEARRLEGVIYLHVMDVKGPEDLDAARRDVLDAEARVIRAFGSRAELEALKAGLPMPPEPSSGFTSNSTEESAG